MNELQTIAVLIPAWHPEPVLVSIVQALQESGCGAILVVDDGNKGRSEEILKEAERSGALILRHAVNLGKGRALKTGFNAFLKNFPHFTGLVTADADGQHSIADILAVARAHHASPHRAVLGCRSFGKDVPLRSRLGNRLTRWIFRWANGSGVTDTQTGLRALPGPLLPTLMQLEGERYEYEMRMLAHICRHHHRPLEIPITTIYLEGNRSSHFDPIRDSMRIYFVLLRFYSSSLLAAAVDLLVFSLAYFVSGNLLISVIIGRLSSLLNFTLNRHFVFRNKDSFAVSLGRYYLLAVTLGGISYLLLSLAHSHLRFPVLPAKILIEVLLSLISFAVQRTFVFRRSNEL
ncbi:MAG: bifunctional glycosyltransferase family 2/GtrA family protein [Acidobacteriaceae bacterium]|nr:bifunctional glycosyltransferase family 2/GtrA family protein [Acidobacteriaceae bacterium]